MTNEILKVLRKEETKRTVKKLQIIKYTNDEGRNFIQLQKVEFFKEADQVRQFGKIKGLTADDLSYIFSHREEITALMTGSRAAQAAAETARNPALPLDDTAPEQDF